tara:strand:- start:637 stop:1215 length:579 start_codon:yes stop_codon:yes gene_type:complete
MDIFKDTIEKSDTSSLLEIDRFKARIMEIWSRMLQETYEQYYDEDNEDTPSIDEFREENALKFANDPEPETELDSLMDMLDGLMDSDEEHEDIKSEAKAPTYGGKQLKSNNEQSKTEATDYEYEHASSKTPGESRSRVQGGSYEGTPSGRISKKKSDTVVTKYTPLIKEVQEQIRSLTDRQRIGRRKLRFRL